MTSFRLGLAVWGYKPWENGPFMPAGVRQADMLRLYGQRMTTVEGNTVFYGVPTAETLQSWAAQTPSTFRFCPKIPKAISHEGALGPQIDSALSFLAHMHSNLGARLGPIFLQLPPSYGPQDGPDLAKLLNAWRREGQHPLLVEVRHLDWFKPSPQQRLDVLLSRLGMGRVILDSRPIYTLPLGFEQERKKPELPVALDPPGDQVFVRFISHPQTAHNLPFLEGWAQQVHMWLDSGKTVYFFMHCPHEDHSPKHARIFQRMLEARGAPVPRLLWDDLPPEPEQVGLF
ncbi:MAG: DUF72 domain-containing protein [Myxococcota bacterium]